MCRQGSLCWRDSDSSGGGAHHGVCLAHGACCLLLPPRPQVIESIFYLWRATHDRKWRDMGWKMWRAIDTHARWEGGYSGALDVSQVRRGVAPSRSLQPCSTSLTLTLELMPTTCQPRLHGLQLTGAMLFRLPWCLPCYPTGS